MSITEKSRFEQIRRNWNSRIRAWKTDGHNQKLYGEDAPRFAEQLWVPTDRIQRALKIGSSKQSGAVMESWPEKGYSMVSDLPSIKACLAHWRDGLSWEDSGIIDLMMAQIRSNGKVDRLRTLEEVNTRYQELDELFFEVKRAGRLSSRQNFIPGNFREEGGILVHIGPNGEPVFGKKGHHRLAIAIALDFSVIPVQLGATFRPAIGHLWNYRQRTKH